KRGEERPLCLGLGGETVEREGDAEEETDPAEVDEQARPARGAEVDGEERPDRGRDQERDRGLERDPGEGPDPRPGVDPDREIERGDEERDREERVVAAAERNGLAAEEEVAVLEVAKLRPAPQGEGGGHHRERRPRAAEARAPAQPRERRLEVRAQLGEED